MVDWRRRRFENYHPEVSRASSRSQNRKPPSGQWQATVPLWEKKFCTQVGSIPWQAILDAKKMMSYYPNVVQWNDSAGEVAFNNAKNRFFAEINGHPCDIPLPDPDIYIDEIDWDSYIDPELLIDLDQSRLPPVEEEQDRSLGTLVDALLLLNQQPIQITGWGDAEDDPTVTTNINSSSGPGLGGHRSCNEVAGAVAWQDYRDNSCDRNCNEGSGAVKDGVFQDYWDSSWGHNQWGNNINWLEHFRSSRTGENWATSRFQGDNVYEQAVMDAMPSVPTRWKSVSTCGPFSHHKSGGAGGLWTCDKPVLS